MDWHDDTGPTLLTSDVMHNSIGVLLSMRQASVQFGPGFGSVWALAWFGPVRMSSVAKETMPSVATAAYSIILLQHKTFSDAFPVEVTCLPQPQFPNWV